MQSPYVVQWQFLKGGYIWQDYAPVENGKIEKTFQEGMMRQTTIRVPRAYMRYTYADPYVAITIDFDSMTQVGEITCGLAKL